MAERAVTVGAVSDPQAVIGPSALPSLRLRIGVFVMILAAGALGAVIGASYGSLACTGDCQTATGATMFVGALVPTIGAAIVARIVLRGSDGWRHR